MGMNMSSFIVKSAIVIASATLALHLASCTPKPRTILVIDSIDALDPDGNPVGELYSDVCAGTSLGCTVTNDNALVVMTARVENAFRDFGKFGDFIIDRYRVTYIRADGRNVPGVDVPYAFDAASSFRVPGNITVSHQIMVVRPQAKLEPPLSELAYGGGAVVLSVLAQIDFYGADIEGRAVEVRGSLDITFADYVEELPEG